MISTLAVNHLDRGLRVLEPQVTWLIIIGLKDRAREAWASSHELVCWQRVFFHVLNCICLLFNEVLIIDHGRRLSSFPDGTLEPLVVLHDLHVMSHGANSLIFSFVESKFICWHTFPLSLILKEIGSKCSIDVPKVSQDGQPRALVLTWQEGIQVVV